VPVDWTRLVAPPTTALVISECQRDVVGDLSKLPQLADAARPAVANVALLAEAARRAGVQVVHASAFVRRDGRGANSNTRLSAGLRRRLTEAEVAGAPTGPEPEEACAVVPEIGLDPRDIRIVRIHGMSPMTETGLDPVLRNLGITTVVATGVSLNVAIPNLVMDAVNRGYEVVVPTDAVAGTPAEYGRAMLEHTIGYLAFLTTTEELIGRWAAPSLP
jgi:nicotinamidase-related amidase